MQFETQQNDILTFSSFSLRLNSRVILAANVLKL